MTNIVNLKDNKILLFYSSSVVLKMIKKSQLKCPSGTKLTMNKYLY